jgi:hypothetical protein
MSCTGLLLLPAGMQKEGYVHSLADLYIHILYHSKINFLHQLLKNSRESLEPDLTLSDTSATCTDRGAVALFNLAGVDMLCDFPTKPGVAGLAWLARAVGIQKHMRRVPAWTHSADTCACSRIHAGTDMARSDRNLLCGAVGASLDQGTSALEHLRAGLQ